MAAAFCSPVFPNPAGDVAVPPELHENAEWRRLLLFVGAADERGGSRARSPQFFLTDDRGPRQELVATVAALLAEAETDDESVSCRYPARRRWIVDHVPGVRDLLRPPRCPALQAFLRELKNARAYLVFASNDLGSPVSAFGHTFLALVPEHLGSQRLLAPAVSFTADDPEAGSAALGYFWRGATSGVDGEFRVTAHLLMVNQYARREQRDLWEYELNLAPSEVERLALHLWELRGVKAEYGFFTWNCSSALLDLVEVARPAAELSRNFDARFHTPVAVLQATESADLVSSVTRRPSIASEVSRRTANLSPEARNRVKPLTRGVGIDRETDGCVLDAAIRTLELQAYDHAVEAGSLDSTLVALLSRRSEVECVAHEPGIPFEADEAPTAAHRHSRAGVGWHADSSESAGLLSYRAVYHDNLDPPHGLHHIPGAISVGELEVAVSSRGVRLEKIGLFDAEFRQSVPWIGAQPGWRASAAFLRSDLAEPANEGGLGLALAGHWGPTFRAEGLGGFGVVGAAALTLKSSLSRNHDLRAGPGLFWLGGTSRVSGEARATLFRSSSGATLLEWVSGIQLHLGSDGLRIAAQGQAGDVPARYGTRITWHRYF